MAVQHWIDGIRLIFFLCCYQKAAQCPHSGASPVNRTTTPKDTILKFDSSNTVWSLWRKHGCMTYRPRCNRNSRAWNETVSGGVQSMARNCPRSTSPAFQLQLRTTSPDIDDPPWPYSEDEDPAMTRVTGGGQIAH